MFDSFIAPAAGGDNAANEQLTLCAELRRRPSASCGATVLRLGRVQPSRRRENQARESGICLADGRKQA
jgi:hypothetical protein